MNGKSMFLGLSIVLFFGQVTSSAENQAVPTYQNPYVFGLINSAEEAVNVDFFSHYRLVLVGEFPDDNPFVSLREQNPDIILLGMTNPYFPSGFTLYPDYTHPENIRPDWVLHTENGDVISYAGPLYANMADTPSMMDLRVKEWQNEYISFNKVLIDEFGLDGIVLDTWSSILPVWAQLNNKIPPAGYSDENWDQMMLEFSRKLRAEIPDVLLIYNGLTVAPGEAGLGDIAYLNIMDGAAYEAYSIYLQMDSSPEVKRYYFDHGIMNAMVRARDANKVFMLQAAGDETSLQSRLYAYGAFLLNAYDKSYFYYDAGDEDEANWFPEWNIELGLPVGTAVQVGGIFTRQFETGLVIVNPTVTEVSFLLDVPMVDLWGERVDGQIILPPFSSFILVPGSQEQRIN